jgi:hypothetical protein
MPDVAHACVEALATAGSDARVTRCAAGVVVELSTESASSARPPPRAIRRAPLLR